MTTEYYQIPSQQGLLPLDSADHDPWLASATSSLSLSDWSVKGKLHNPPSLFDSDDAESMSWKHVVPMHAPAGVVGGNNGKQQKQQEVKAPSKTPKQFHSTASKIDAWSVVDHAVVVKQKKQTKTSPQQQQQQQQQQLQQLQQLQQQLTPAVLLALAPVPSPAPAADDKPLEEELTHQNRYKTELCKSFTETGNCRYGVKCQFAHGKEEIRPILRHPKYKTEICKTFHTTGTCPYGIRCRFIHTRSKEESILTMVKAQAQAQVQHSEEEEDLDDDDESSVNAPPGIPVPQWSKSWTMSLAAAMPSKNIRVSDRLAEHEPAF